MSDCIVKRNSQNKIDNVQISSDIPTVQSELESTDQLVVNNLDTLQGGVEYVLGPSRMVVKPYINPITGQDMGGVEIDILETDPEFRGQGYAKRLRKLVLDIYDRKGITTRSIIAPRDAQTTEAGIANLLISLGYEKELINGVWDGMSMVRYPKVIEEDFPKDNIKDSKTFDQIASIPFVQDTEQALDIYSNIFSEKYRGSDFSFDNGEPRGVFRLPNGDLTFSYRDAILKSEGDDILFGFAYQGKLQGLLKISTSTDNSSPWGLLNDMISTGLVKETKLKKNSDYVHQAGGNKVDYRMYNLQTIKDFLVAHPDIFSIKTDDQSSTFSFDVYEASAYKITTEDDQVIDVSGADIDERLSNVDYNPPELGELIIQRASDKGVYILKDETVSPFEATKTEENLFDRSMEFLNSLGVELTSIEQYNENYNIKNGEFPNAMALADIANKVIAFRDGNVSKDAFMEEASHFMIESFNNQDLVDQAAEEVQYTQEYFQYADQYREAYSKQKESPQEVERLVRREVLGKILSKQLTDRFVPDTVESTNIFNTLAELIQEFFASIRAFLTPESFSTIDKLNEDIKDKIVSKEFDSFEGDLSSQDYVLFQLNTSEPSYRVAVASLVRAKDVINDFFIRKAPKHQLDKIQKDMDSIAVWETFGYVASATSSELKNLEDILSEKSLDQLSIEEVSSMTNLTNTLIPNLKTIRDELIGLDPIQSSGIYTQNDNLTDAEKRRFINTLDELQTQKDNLLNATNKVIQEFDRIQGKFNLFNNAEIYNKYVVEPFVEQNGLTDEQREEFTNISNTHMKDISMFAGMLGSLVNRGNPIMSMIRKTVGSIFARAQRLSQSTINPFVNNILNNGLDKHLGNLQMKDENGKPTNQLRQGVNQVKFNQEKERFELTEMAAIINEGRDVKDQIKYDDWRELRDKLPPLNAEQNLEFKRRFDKWGLDNRELRYTKEYYEMREKLYEGVTFESKQTVESLNTERAKIVARYRDENGRVDRTKLSKNDLERIVDINRSLSLAKQPYDDFGLLKRGLKEELDKIVPDYSISNEELTDSEILTRDMIRIAQNRVAVSGEFDTGTTSEDFLNTIKEFENAGQPELAYQFLMMNGGLSFTDKYWNETEHLNLVKSYETVLTRQLLNKGISQREYDEYIALLEVYREQSNVLRKYLTVSRVPNNPAEVQVSEPHKDIIREVEQRLDGIRRELRNKNEGISDMSRVLRENINVVPLENSFNIDYVNELDARGIGRMTQEEVTFATEHLTETSRDNVGTFRQYLQNNIEFLKQEGLEAIRPAYQRYVEDLSIGSSDFMIRAQMNFIERNISSYYRRSVPQGYSMLIEGMKSGDFKISNILEQGNNLSPYLELRSNLEWSDTDFGDKYLNKNFDPEGVRIQPKKSKYMDTSSFSRYAFTESDRDRYLSGVRFEDLEAKSNVEEFDTLRQVIEFRQKSLDNLGETGNISKYTLPSISKNIIEKRIALSKFEKGSWKAAMRDILQYRPDELEGGVIDAEGNPISQYSEIRAIPKYYTKNLDISEDISQDVLGMLVLDHYQSQLYRSRSDGQNKILMSLVQAENVKVEGKETVNSNFYKMLKEYVDANLFGIQYNFDYPVSIFGQKINIAKFLNLMNKWVRNINLKWNPIVDITGATTMWAARKQIDFASEYYSKDSANSATKLASKMVPQYLAESGKVNKTSKMNHILEFLGVTEFNDRTEFSDQKRGVRLLFKSGFGLSKVSNMTGSPIMALTVLKDYRYTDGTFINYEQFKARNTGKAQEELDQDWRDLEMNSMYDTIDFSEGVPSFRAEFVSRLTEELKNEGLSETAIEDKINQVFDNAQDNAFNKTRFLNSIIDGVLPDEDRVMAQRNPFLNFIMTHRSWLSIIVDRRFKNEHYSPITGQTEIGHYRAVLRLFDNILKSAKQEHSTLYDAYKKTIKTLSPQERKALRVVQFDTMLTAALTLMGFLVVAAADDDDNKDNWLVQFASLIYIRTASEVYSTNALGIANSGYEVITEPLVMKRYVDNAMDGLGLDMFDEVTRGNYAGFNKVGRSAFKMWHTRKMMNMLNMRSTFDSYRHFNANTLYLLGKGELADDIIEGLR